MEVILLERIAKLGQMGDQVRVRDGYARNFLLPQGKALRATEANKKKFDSERTELEARNLERRSEAEVVAGRLDGHSFVVVRQAGETGQLYGSVSTRDLVEILDEAGFKVGRSQIELNQPIKSIGLHKVTIALHPDVDSAVTVNIARSEDEAERQARGEDLSIAPTDETDESVEAVGEESEGADTEDVQDEADNDTPVESDTDTDGPTSTSA